jgi:hypothetical protein
MSSANESTSLLGQSMNRTENIIGIDDAEKYEPCIKSSACSTDNFFDLEKGWIQYFHPWLNMNQLFFRNRERL